MPEIFFVNLVVIKIHFNFKTVIPAELEKSLSQLELEFDKVINKKIVLGEITPQWSKTKPHPMQKFLDSQSSSDPIKDLKSPAIKEAL